MNRHVCFLCSAFEREDALIVHRQGKSLVQAGYKVTCLFRDDIPTEVRYGIEMRSIGSPVGSVKERIKSNGKIFKGFLKDFSADVYQISEPEMLHIGLWLKRKGNRVVFNLREWYPLYYTGKTGNGFLKKIIEYSCEKYFRYVSKRIDGIFNCMPEMHDYIEKVMPCHYFEDVANFPIVNKNFTLSFEEYTQRRNVVSYFGSIYNISCQEEFLEAINSIHDVKYLLAGVFYDEGYKQKCMKLPGWKKVDFRGKFMRAELAGIINSSVIGNVMKDFNQTETPQGSYSIIKIFETMEAAVPVILSKVPLYEAMVEKYHCGICVNPHDVNEIRDAICYLLEHKQEAYEMGQNGRRAVLEEFSWDSQERNYLKVMDALTQI